MKRVQHRGFTLIEIMLVIVIIGCAVGIVVLSIPGLAPGGQDDLRTQATRLTAVVQQLSEQAVLEGRVIALRDDKTGYRFMVRARKADVPVEQQKTAIATEWDDQLWIPYVKDKVVTEGTFPTGTQVDLSLGGLTLDNESRTLGVEKQDWFARSGDDSDLAPQILLLPGNEITPFELTLTAAADSGSDSQPYLVQIRGDETGKVEALDRAALAAISKE